ncbi:MFS general substrate transporter [Dentipellis sp. KUC8613]|nr:MFS general substrate transporter [Dentipellis sp. KUC8613]
MARFPPTDEIELSSRVGSQAVRAPAPDNVVVLQDGTQPEAKASPTTRANVQFASLCLTMLLAGWNDASTGPLLPRIQAVYHVGFAIVSLVFVLSSVGFVVGSISNVIFNDKFGFGKTLVLGSASCIAGYAIQISAPPFPVFTVGYFLNGFGLALLNAQSNGYVASLRDPTRMGILHATYGVGALSSPLVATQFAQLHRWSFHFFVSLGIALLSTAVLCVVFRFRTQEECLAQIGLVNEEEGSIDDNKFYQIFRLKALHVLAFFILVYVGTELTIGGWIVTYISQVRGGGASSGYISSGFFGGIVVGRTLLLWVNKRVGERIVIFIYVALAIGLELIIWFVPSFIGGAVSIALVGVFMGPIYPIVMNESRRVLPRWLLTACIGWIAGFGQTGSAILPFMTGAIASKAGIKSLQPLLVSLMTCLVVLWALVPKGHSRSD